MFCIKCGSEVPENIEFCSHCGNALTSEGSNVPQTPSQSKEQIPNHLISAILSTIFCCVPLGIVAIVYACQVNTKLAQGDIEGGKKASKNAYIWILAGVALGVLLIIISQVVPGLIWLIGLMVGFEE